MSQKPIFVATHPRACSTAFEMVFMTRTDILNCVHEPFGDAFYYGPERLSSRYEQDINARQDSSFSESTYKTVLDRLERDAAEGKRLLIKDITYNLFPPEGKPASIAPSLAHNKRGVGTGDNGYQPAKEPPYPYDTESEPGNPTVVPTSVLKQFHFIFLIRHPRRSIPSFFKCTVPPQDKVTSFYGFTPSEAGYREVRRLFDYLVSIGEIRMPKQEGANGTLDPGESSVDVCVVDADDLLDHPAEIVEAVCKSVGIDYRPGMLRWDTKEEQERAQKAFAKWPGFHDDALAHHELKPRNHQHESRSEEEEYASWVEKFGEKGAKTIRDTVNENLADYEYLKQFAIKI